MKWDQFLRILQFLNFTDNRNKNDKNDKNYDRLWKIRDIFEVLNNAYAKFYNSSEHLAVDICILFKGRVVFEQYNLKTKTRFGIKMFKLCDYWLYI